ncbi:nitrite reductase small subunit NirD [Aneurinibacillus sp. Ricciae_BoGa-3]|uniref:nitrite reductase small subunit NirD n=1 Tax=Aneurinibacillus sp. Ricciae_BoGa-3 TaxID=3022697 RepID=UPI002340262D|nr:nitrite reductase small subunit NirD [Aneurinibacillus sp. Ricciae_BoGa-3]WCK55265.1 nitrite reductase small subunit NirD [Aneurinibacillus sp. Ricciae_BoGa-3]
MKTKVNKKYKVAELDELPLQEGWVVTVADEEIVLFSLTGGDVRAVENLCPKGGPIAEGIVSGEYVFTPLYDWKISLIDGKVQAPDTGSIKTYQVEIADGNVYLYL